VSIQLIAL
jgi:hypothetical protein